MSRVTRSSVSRKQTYDSPSVPKRLREEPIDEEPKEDELNREIFELTAVIKYKKMIPKKAKSLYYRDNRQEFERDLKGTKVTFGTKCWLIIKEKTDEQYDKESKSVKDKYINKAISVSKFEMEEYISKYVNDSMSDLLIMLDNKKKELTKLKNLERFAKLVFYKKNKKNQDIIKVIKDKHGLDMVPWQLIKAYTDKSYDKLSIEEKMNYETEAISVYIS